MKRDHKDYDLSRVNLNRAAAGLDRYYSANFFRYSFVQRLVDPLDDVLEIGCGRTQPLFKILTGGPSARANTYLGVDMCKLESTGNARVSLKGEFNFVERWKELDDGLGFSVVIHIEVIEHMRTDLGEKMLRGCYKLLRHDGRMLMATPCYDGKKQLFGHVHEYTVTELQELLKKTGFTVKQRFGTMMDLRHLNKLSGLDDETANAVTTVKERLKRYFNNDALSCFFAPMFPDYAKDCFWVCKKS